MGYIRGYADRMDLAAMTPQGKLSSTGHALANISPTDPEFLVYAPSGGKFTVDLVGQQRPVCRRVDEPGNGRHDLG